jgi:hypothetical protein
MSCTPIHAVYLRLQRLESELKASYATKNFTIKNGMLEIEKQYRITIESSLESQQLWHDIMNLLVRIRGALIVFHASITAARQWVR